MDNHRSGIVLTGIIAATAMAVLGLLGAGMTPRLAAAFSAPVAHLKLNYLPGVALLRPIAEFTGSPDSNHLEFWLPLKPQTEKLDSNYHP